MTSGFVVALAAGVAMLAAARGPSQPPQGGRPSRLSDVLTETIESRGIDAAVAQYRTLGEQGFPGLSESESDTNNLGYKLLGKEQVESAILVFRLNVETHPLSANAYDSLGEAYVAAGDTSLAIEAFQRAVLWHTCAAMYIAATSFFLGQSRPFPDALFGTGVLVGPGVVLVLSLIFWLIRVLFTSAYRRAAPPKTSLVAGQAAT